MFSESGRESMNSGLRAQLRRVVSGSKSSFCSTFKVKGLRFAGVGVWGRVLGCGFAASGFTVQIFRV